MSLGLRHIKIYSVKWNIVGNVYYPAFTNVLSVSRFYVFKHLKKYFWTFYTWVEVIEKPRKEERDRGKSRHCQGILLTQSSQFLTPRCIWI